MIDLIIDFLGEPPNDLILNLYYVLAIVIIIYFVKLTFKPRTERTMPNVSFTK